MHLSHKIGPISPFELAVFLSPAKRVTRDIRYAIRSLARTPGFTAAAILTLALGIGGNVLVFGLADSLVLHPFPYPSPDRLVAIGASFPRIADEERFIEVLSGPEYHEIRQAKSLQKVIAFDLGNRNISGGDRPERVFVLLIGAGLLLKSWSRLSAVEPGMRLNDVLTMRLTLPPEKYKGEAISNFFRQLIERVRTAPGVENAAIASLYPPMSFSQSQVRVDGQQVARQGELPSAIFTIVSPEYFTTLDIPVLEGRPFTDADRADAPGVAVVNETFARQLLEAVSLSDVAWSSVIDGSTSSA